MSSKKLFISIGTHLHFALNVADLVDGALIKFDERINNVTITCNGAALTIVDDEVVAAMKPIIEFTLATKTEEPVIIDAEKKNVKSELSSKPYVFKMGSSSQTAPLTRTQRRNKNRRLRRMHERLDKQRKLNENVGFRNDCSPDETFGVC